MGAGGGGPSEQLGWAGRGRAGGAGGTLLPPRHQLHHHTGWWYRARPGRAGLALRARPCCCCCRCPYGAHRHATPALTRTVLHQPAPNLFPSLMMLDCLLSPSLTPACRTHTHPPRHYPPTPKSTLRYASSASNSGAVAAPVLSLMVPSACMQHTGGKAGRGAWVGGRSMQTSKKAAKPGSTWHRQEVRGIRKGGAASKRAAVTLLS